MKFKVPTLVEVSPEYREMLTLERELAQECDNIKAQYREMFEAQVTGQDPARQSRVDALARGESVTYPESQKEQIEQMRMKVADLEDAQHAMKGRISDAGRLVSRIIVGRVEPEHDRLLKTACKHLADAIPALSEYYDLRQTMVDGGIGLGPLFNMMPDFIGNPRNKDSACAHFIRDAAKAGYCKLPSEFVK
jgi:cell fate (sporulation/competence/biofilm development) regulator YlbF (YheA/YmcA/DUF963 family)